MSDIAEFSVLPPLRCSMPLGPSDRGWCGAAAVSMTVAESPWRVQYFCASHAHLADQPLVGPFVFRRVSLVCEVQFAGVTLVWGPAQAEALARLEAVVSQAGGLLNLTSVTSVLGRWTPPTERGVHKRGRGNATP